MNGNRFFGRRNNETAYILAKAIAEVMVPDELVKIPPFIHGKFSGTAAWKGYEINVP